MRSHSVVGLFLALVVSALPAAASEVVVFRVEDTVQAASQRFIERSLGEAEARGAELAVLELDTPGGLLDSTREITTAITGSKVPVVVYVAPAGARAASAGFFILISADVAAMAPGTNTGAATPVLVPMIPTGGDAEPSEEMKAKVTNDASAMMRAFASTRGRNVELAVKAITEALSFTAEEALENELIEFVAGSLDGLLDQLDGVEVTRFDGSTMVLDLASREIVRLEPTGLERFQSVLASPMVAFLLMALAGIGLYTEITHPGAILPGVVGVVALLLFLYSTSVLPVNWLGLLLIAAAIGLFALEVKVTSYGLLTAAGLGCFVLGAVMLFDTPIPEMRLSLGLVVPTALVIAGVTIGLLWRVVVSHRTPPITGVEGLVGELGKALSDLDPTGKVLVHGEYWDARAVAEAIVSGSEVHVVAVKDRRLDVRSASEPTEGG